MKLKLYFMFEQFFARLTAWAERKRTAYAYCPDCGRNRYFGAPCKNIG